MWAVSAILFLVWFVLKFILHKGGFIHIVLLMAISIFVVQLIAHRKTQYQKNASSR